MNNSLRGDVDDLTRSVSSACFCAATTIIADAFTDTAAESGHNWDYFPFLVLGFYNRVFLFGG